MPPLLIVPPVDYIGLGPEPAASLHSQGKTWIQESIESLSTKNDLLTKIPSGSFAGTEVRSGTGNHDLILKTHYLGNRKEGCWTAQMIRPTDCHLLGARWRCSNGETGGRTFSLAIGTKSMNINPHLIVMKPAGQLTSSRADWFAIVAGETLASQSMPVITSVGRLVCEVHWQKQAAIPLTPAPVANETGTAKTADEMILRTHRVVNILMDGKKDAKGTTLITGRAQVTSGVFAKVGQTLVTWEKPRELEGETLARELADTLKPLAHSLESLPLAVTKRQGRFVYLKRGRAYGLQIGMHLLGPRGERLHIIRFQPEAKEIDTAIALIRREEKNEPLRDGDVLIIDPALYSEKK